MLTNSDYTIGWITALDIELAACQAILDEPLHPTLAQDARDSNSYTLGQLGSHNIVVACLPSMGNNAAAIAAANMIRSFPNVRIGLMIGVGGGVPDHTGHDIRLGDIVVSYPEGTHGGVVQFDFGTVMKDDEFIRKGYLNKPPSSLLTAVKTLKAKAERKGYEFERYFAEMLEQNPMMVDSYSRPEIDDLYESKYNHVGAKANCSGCSSTGLVKRPSRRSTSHVHYGLIGSSNSVIRDSVTRDNLHKEQGIICLEMEAAGLMNDFPCLVIRGICDYCDTHKNKSWQRFASANAAAFAKELLTYVSPIRTNDAVRPSQILEEMKSQIEKQHDLQCLARLRITDPRMDKKHLEDMKGGLLREAYIWILRNEEFKTWRRDTDKKLLWIRGDPGKGKTMLLCGIINELSFSKERYHIAYFFCRATENKLNTAVSVLRGIIFMLADQRPPLTKHIRKYTDKAQGSIFEELNAWFALSDILKDCLNDEISQNTTILVDALDECIEGREKLTSLIVSYSKSCSARWIISSRNWPEIEKDLKTFREKNSISLELNAFSVTTAVQCYIDHRVNLIAERQDYDNATRTKVSDHLHQHAQGTFLWVALSCNHLESLDSWESVEIENFQAIPPGLSDLYSQMLRRILSSRHSPVLLQILALVTLAYRPLYMDELMKLVDVDAAILRSCKFMNELVGMCGSFLTIEDSRVEFVHLSAKDFLLNDGYKFVFPSGPLLFHKQFYLKSIKKLESVLKKDIYALKDPGIMMEDVVKPVPDPLLGVKYSCVYWTDHLMEYVDYASDQEICLEYVESILQFFETQYIYWLEAVSLLKEIHVLNSAMTKLDSYLSRGLLTLATHLRMDQNIRFTQLAHLTQDALRFMRYFQHALLHFPLQIYVSGLLFSPQDSMIKRLFRHEIPVWAHVRRGLSRSWPSAMNLEFDTYPFHRLRFSPDSKQIVAVSQSQSILCGWDVTSGQLLYTIPVSINFEELIGGEFSFLGNDQVASYNQSNLQIELWSVPNAQLLRIIDLKKPVGRSPIADVPDECDEFNMRAIFSTDGKLFAYSTETSRDIHVYQTLSGTIRITLNQPYSKATCLAFSPDNLQFATSYRNGVYIWDIETGRLLWKNTFSYSECIFSPSGRYVALVDSRIELWDWTRNELVWSLEEASSGVFASRRVAAFMSSTETLVFSNHGMLEQWSSAEPHTTCSRAVCRTSVDLLACSSNDQIMATAEAGSNIHVWNFSNDAVDDSLMEPRLFTADCIKLFLNNDRVFLFVRQTTTEIHVTSIINENSSPNVVVKTECKQRYPMISLSNDYRLVAFVGADLIEIWNLTSMERIRIIEIDREGLFGSLQWHPDGIHFTIVGLRPGFLWCWNAITGNMVKCWAAPQWVSDAGIEASTGPVELRRGTSINLHWCPNGKRLIISNYSNIDIWSADTGSWQNLITGLSEGPVVDGPIIFSSDGEICAYVSISRIIKVWNLNTLELLFEFPSQGLPHLFSVDKYWLKTNQDWFEISSDLEPDEVLERRAAFHINVERDRTKNKERSWIRLGNRKLIWLPAEYKPLSGRDCEDVDGDRVAICIGSDVLVVDFLREKWLDKENGFELPFEAEQALREDPRVSSDTHSKQTRVVRRLSSPASQPKRRKTEFRSSRQSSVQSDGDESFVISATDHQTNIHSETESN